MTRRRVKTFIRCSFSFNNFKVSRSHIIQLDSLCVTVHPKLLREIPIAMGGQIQINGIIKQKQCASSLKDWIKVNAYVTLFFATSCITNFVMIRTNPQLKDDFAKRSLAMQKNIPPEAAAMMPQVINGLLIAMLVFGISLLLHISLSFTFIKTKSNLFEEE